MYIAGLGLSISPAQALEGLIVYSAFDLFRYIRRAVTVSTALAESKGGRIRAETSPLLGRILTPIHLFATFGPGAVYITALALNGFRQPGWMTQFALPTDIAGARLDLAWRGALRVGACLAGLALRNLAGNVLRHLGDQWDIVGRRERPRLVQTGPYAWVRHPLYTAFLLQNLVACVMFWSYVPLVGLGVTAAALAVKMPVEEAMIQRDEGIKEAYRAYMEKVPARVIPYVW